MYPDSEILFPPRCIEQLSDLRGPRWQDLARRVSRLPHNHEDVLAFGLLMIRLGSCLTCDLDSYRASLGCCTCARRTVSGYKEDDASLVELFEKALVEVKAFVEKQQPLSISLMLEEKAVVPSGRLM
jgi:hypothetical protein